MKKNIIAITSLLLSILMIFSSFPVTVFAENNNEIYNTEELPAVIPSYPSLGKKYWVIFNEGFRDGRLEMSTFNVTDNSGTVKIIWSEGLYAETTRGEITECMQFHYTNEKWIWDRDYDILTDNTEKIFASNVNIYDENGTLIIPAKDWNDISDGYYHPAYEEGLTFYNGHYYKIFTTRMSWTSAEAACEKLGGHLATVTSAQEQQFIDSLNSSNRRLWLGGYRESAASDDWYWITGEKWSYTNWANGEPNNSHNVISNENRVSLWPDVWNDLNDSSSEQSGYICEWESRSVPEDRSLYNGHYYKVFPDGTVSSWEEAKTFCESMGGYLAVISSEQENEYLNDLINSENIEVAYFGYSDAAQEGEWRWVDNESSDYTNWHDGEPNQEDENEDYAEFYFKWNDGTWNDGNFNNGTAGDETAFICEWSSSLAGSSSKKNIKYDTQPTGNDGIIIIPRMKNTVVNGSIANISHLTDGYNAIVKDACVEIDNDKYTVKSDKIDVAYEKGKNGFTVSAEKYNDYIFPAEVTGSFSMRSIYGRHQETIYMRRNKEDGKPYVSSVFAKTAGSGEAYCNLLDGPTFTINENTSYDIIVSAGNVSGDVTYYISQDNSGEHTLSNKTGVFSSASFSGFSKNKKIHVWVTAGNGGSEQTELKLVIRNIDDNEFYKAVKNGKYSFGGKNGISVEFPNDWVLIGGKSLDMSAFSFPAQCTLDPEKGTIRIAVGLAKYNATADPTKDEKTWSLFKDSMKGISKEAESWQQGLFDYHILKKLKEIGIDKDAIKELAKEKKFSAGGNVLLAIEGTYSGNEIVITEGYGAIEFEIKASLDGQYLEVVYGISGGMDGSFGLTASRQVCSNDAPLDWNLKLNLTPNLKVYAGVGIQNVASVDAYGILKLPFNWSFLNQQIDIALSGEVGLEAKVFIFETNIVLLSGTLGPKYFYYGDDNSKQLTKNSVLRNYLTAAGPANAEKYTLQSRDYAENTSAWLGEAKPFRTLLKAKASSSAAGGLTFKKLQTSVYENSNARIITCGDTTLAAWIEDDVERDDYNRTRLVYSLYDADTDSWSAPKAVCDDGYMDAAPYLATDGSEIFITWQKLCKTFNAENSLTEKDILSSGEICLAKYDKNTDSFTDFTRLTNDSAYDYSPALSVTNGTPSVYYCSSPEAALSESDGNCIMVYSDGKTMILKNNLSTVYSLDVCGNEIAYAADTDGNIQTTEDIRTFYGFNSFGQFDPSAENPEMNFAYGTINGTDTLFVSDGTNIYYKENNGLKTVFDENTKIDGQLHTVRTSSGLSLFWTNENEKGNDVYVCSYADGKWSGAVRVSDRDDQISNLTVTSLSNGKIIGLCNETQRLEDKNGNGYIDGESDLSAFTVNEFTDLTAVFTSVNETDLIPGQTVNVQTTVENNGNTDGTEFTLTLTDAYGTEITTGSFSAPDPGKTEDYLIPYPVPENFSGGNITVTVNTENDNDNTDNVCVYSVDRPDLLILKDNISNDGILYTVDASVYNTNFTEAENVTLKAYLGNTEGEAFDSVFMGNISKNECKNVRFAFCEDDIITDDLGQRLVYLIAEDENGNDTQLVLSFNESDAVCGHPETEITEAIAPTCTEAGKTEGIFCPTCQSYITEVEEIPALGHDIVKDAAVPATCTTTGLTAGEHCTRCDIKVEQSVVAMLGHTAVTDKAVAATCTKSGKTKGSHCSVCGEVITAQKTVAKLGHTVVTDKAVEATCTKSGKTKGSHCSVCGEVITAQKTVAKLGHTVVTDKAVAATCTKSGKTKGSHCSVCGEVITAQKTVAKLGHSYKSTVTVKATTSKSGKLQDKCSRCGYTKSSSTVIPMIKSSTLSYTTATYNGKTKSPTVTVKDSKGNKLVKGTDYTVSYSNNKNIGKATAKITFKGKYSGTKSLTYKIIPGKVTGLKATQTTTSVKLSWTAVSGAKTYRVYKYSSTTKKYTQITSTTGTSCTVKNLKAGTAYTYYVRASKTVSGTTYYSSAYTPIKTGTKTLTPKAPTLTAGTKKITVKWSKVTGASGYEVQMKKGSSGTYGKPYSTTKLSCTRSSLTKGSTYYFRVRAYKTVDGKKIYSAYSKEKYTKAK